MATKDAKIRIGVIDKTSAQLHRIKKSLLGLKATAMSAGTALTGLGGVAGIAGMTAMAKSAIDLGSSITDMAVATRTGIEEIQVLNFAAQEAGASQEQMANLLVRVQKSASDAARGLSTAKDAFSKLNINASDFLELSPEQMLETVGQSLAQAGADTEAYGAALDLLGTRNAPKLMEVLQRLGTEGFDEIARQARESGQIMEEETARRLDNAADSIERFKKRSTILFGEAIANMMDSEGPGRKILAMQLAKLAAQFGGGIVDAVVDAFVIAQAAGEAAMTHIALRFGADISNALAQAFRAIPGGALMAAPLEAVRDALMGMDSEFQTIGDAISHTIATTEKATNFAEDWGVQWQEGINLARDEMKKWKEDLEESNTIVAGNTEETSAWMNDIAGGVTRMGNALENGLINAAKNGKAAFGDMAQFILAEIQRILIRSLILRPLFGAIGGFIGDNPIGNAFSGSFGGGKAGGGMVTGGKSYMVGERGPEIVTMGGNGYITPNHKMGGGDVYNIDARGADKEGLRNLENAILALNGSIENRAIAAVRNASTRKPSYI
jgi:hypothetical protein